MFDDERFMSIALRLAHRGLGNTYPNPTVGCVVTNSAGSIVGRGWTAMGGRPHAEVVALKQAGEAAAGSTVYVTLEPCCHHGQTGPCTAALISAGVRRVVIAALDPDKRVSGKGARSLADSGVEVKLGVLQQQAEELNVGFFYSKTKRRPFITVKLATTLDGKISLPNGSDRWITNELTRKWVHKQRAMHDGIMVGSNTVVADDPMLDCRLPGLEEHSPIRIVIDRSGKLCSHHKVVATSDVVPTYIATNNDDHKALHAVRYLRICERGDFLAGTMNALAEELGITRLFVEGGGVLVTELLKRGLVDQFIWCRANRVCGEQGVESILNLNELPSGHCHFSRVKTLTFMEDTVDIFQVLFANEHSNTAVPVEA
ncbi:bifunctional diaminohydroxyphosphoribosylaminopyrimidine deaminase/5-amino-6-(5-phosphoribosylamino)uracil reductase RibD [Anaplasma marginale]|uniref:bifunctional diaminohydroxyphosphoribosylaminopyrimidine deaminase/5-amino-6-(5-phosphoribosylamino)uracil reductase RibD n=1 Tax=Anaplasma marginale TaxID=770 RepID=UPI0002FDAE77|nr:bifunctional diaminohydroxyphosphoribosylaminopyrimidine deaminase/5-amino-6-(5-phosphoribosylamino)uracil reductase RibD [Anaplasma marginale]